MMGSLNNTLSEVGAQAFKTEHLWKARVGESDNTLYAFDNMRS